MKAIAIRRDDREPAVIEKPAPEPAAGEVLVRTHRVGVDGTDHEVIAGAHGGFPAGEDHLVLGHEAVGRVVDANGTDLDEGDVVVPTVRRRPPGEDPSSGRDRLDMAPAGATLERGIDRAHGFMAEYFTSAPEHLVRLPESLGPAGFLVEPLSVAEKALELAAASRSPTDWQPESALVLGNGSLGLLTLALLDGVERRYCLGRRQRPDPSIDAIEALGATYVDATRTPVEEVPEAHEPMDLVYEATGHAKHAVSGVGATAPGGVLALLGVPSSWTFEVDGGALHRDLVVNNKAVVGSVNASADHFRSAVDALAGLDDAFVSRFVSDVYGVERFEGAFDPNEKPIKTAIEFGDL